MVGDSSLFDVDIVARKSKVMPPVTFHLLEITVEKKKFEQPGISHAIQLNSSIKEKESKDSQKTMPN